MLAEGVIAENDSLQASMHTTHLINIAPKELIAPLHNHYNPDSSLLSTIDAQILVGIELSAEVLS